MRWKADIVPRTHHPHGENSAGGILLCGRLSSAVTGKLVDGQIQRLRKAIFPQLWVFWEMSPLTFLFFFLKHILLRKTAQVHPEDWMEST